MQKWQRREDSKGNEWWEVGSAKFGCLDDALLFSAAPDLLTAEEKQEKAELVHANCPECLGEGVPELCEKCFPLFDDARLSRRAAIAKAKP